jgi:hypothetical protein
MLPRWKTLVGTQRIICDAQYSIDGPRVSARAVMMRRMGRDCRYVRRPITVSVSDYVHHLRQLEVDLRTASRMAYGLDSVKGTYRQSVRWK